MPLLGFNSDGRKELCHVRDSQNWLIRVKSSALVTGSVLAAGTHPTRCLFGELHSIFWHGGQAAEAETILLKLAKMPTAEPSTFPVLGQNFWQQSVKAQCTPDLQPYEGFLLLHNKYHRCIIIIIHLMRPFVCIDTEKLHKKGRLSFKTHVIFMVRCRA